MVSTFKKVFPYVLIGVGIGAVIHNWIPEEWIVAVLGNKKPFGVVLATLIGRTDVRGYLRHDSHCGSACSAKALCSARCLRS
jgi:hypothetical protein